MLLIGIGSKVFLLHCINSVGLTMNLRMQVGGVVLLDVTQFAQSSEGDKSKLGASIRYNEATKVMEFELYIRV